jgi:dihydroorotase
VVAARPEDSDMSDKIHEANSWLVENARWIDPAVNVDRQARLLFVNGKIVGFDILDGDLPTDVQRLDGRGLIGGPGLVDLGTVFGEPGREEDETLTTGLMSALAGGFTSIAMSSNTLPPIDSPALVQFIQQKAARAKLAKLYPLGCISKDRQGEELAEIGSLVEAGVVALSDAPRAIENTALMRRALEYCSMFNRPLLDHPEVLALSRGGVMHEDMTQLVLGLPPLPAEAEDLATARDLRLVETTGGRLHLMSISTSGSVEICRHAKSRGVAFTAGMYVANTHMLDEQLRSFDPNCKINPPMRSKPHIEACLKGLADGTISILSSGHRPCSLEKKMQELDIAPFGMVALETAVGQVVTHLVKKGVIDWSGFFSKLSTNPAALLGIDAGTLRVGAPADIVLIRPDKAWIVDAPAMKTKAYNTPLNATELIGQVAATFVDGVLKHQG